MKANKIKDLLMIIIVAFFIYGLNYNTFFNSYLHHSQGKDYGFARQGEVMVLLSIIFFFVLSEKRKLLSLFLGLGFGIISFLIAHKIRVYIKADNGISFQIIAGILFIISFYCFRLFKFL